MSSGHCMNSSVLLCSQVLSAVSLDPNVVFCVSSSAEFIKALDKIRKAGIQYSFNFFGNSCGEAHA